MGGAVSAGVDHDDLIDKLREAGYIKTKDIETVFRAVDRGFYFLPDCRDYAYRDMAWKKGNVHLSAPCIYGEVMESLELKPGLSFLNLGSGTGYLSTMVGLILGPYGINHGVELHEDVIEYAHYKLFEFKKTSPAIDSYEFCEPVFVKGNSLCLNGYSRLYDRVYCGAACPENHETYMKNLLKIGGVLVMPLNDQLMHITRTSDTTWDATCVLSVSFATLQLPSPDATNKPINLPEVNPVTLQEACRSAIRSLLRDQAKAEFPDIAVRKRKQYTGKRRRAYNKLIIPLMDSSEDEAGVEPRGNAQDYRQLLSRFARVAPRSSIFRNINIEQHGRNWWDPDNEPENIYVRPSSSTPYEDDEDEDEAVEDDDDIEEEESEDEEEDISERRRKIAKREKFDSGICTDMDNTQDGSVHSSESEEDIKSDREDAVKSNRDDYLKSDHDETTMEVESSDEQPTPSKSPIRKLEEENVPLYSVVMRQKISSLPLPPTLKDYLNYYRPF